VKIDIFCWGVEGRKKVAICSWAIKFDCSACVLTSLTQQSNSDDVGDGKGNGVVGNEVI
jgi:hypothetical protein